MHHFLNYAFSFSLWHPLAGHSITLTHTHFIISYVNINFDLGLLFSGKPLGNKARDKQNVIKTSGGVEVNFIPSPPTRLYGLIIQNIAD